MRSAVIAIFVISSISLSGQYRVDMNFSGMGPHVGKGLYVRIVEDSLPVVWEAASVKTIIDSPDMSLSILALLEGKSYNIGWFVDVNENGKYDPPPTDHAWSLRIPLVMTSWSFDLPHNTFFTDISYPNPSETMPSFVSSEWSGTWTNKTFETQGTGNANLQLDYVNQTIYGTITMEGAFGSPTPITMSGTGPFYPDQNVATMNMDEPFSGTLTFSNGRVTGSISYTSVGVVMDIDGNYGYNQILFDYTMSGIWGAEGWFVLHRTQTTDVTDNPSSATTNNENSRPEASVRTLGTQAQVEYTKELGTADNIIVYDVTGRMTTPIIVNNTPGHATLDISPYTNGAYITVLSIGQVQLAAIFFIGQ